MNPNMPYGPPHRQRQHDIPPYGRPHMGPHPGYPPYYPPMGPMMPPYSHYPPPPQQWYPPQYPYVPPYHPPRQPYYPSSMLPPPPVQQPHQGPLVVSSHPSMPQTARTYSQPQPNSPASLRRPSMASSVSQVQAETPPSRAMSQVSAVQERRDESLASPAVSAAIQDHTVPTNTISNTEPFTPPLPWLSVPGVDFPSRAMPGTRKLLRSQLLQPLYFPPETAPLDQPPVPESKQVQERDIHVSVRAQLQDTATTHAEAGSTQPSDTQSDQPSTQPTTPSSAVPSINKLKQTPTQQKAARGSVPVVPVIPAIPASPTTARKIHRDSVTSARSRTDSEVAASTPVAEVQTEPNVEAAPAPPPVPKSWADLVRKQSAGNAATSASGAVLPVINGLAPPRNESLGEVLGEINVADVPSKVAFLRPRGLVNTGNMCYMNSVLQLLVFCTPFYDFLDRVASKAAHAFKSTTPLVDAMIMFMREYPAIDTAATVEQLRLRLKPEDFEKYGDSLRPDFVYEILNKLPRFRDMRRGHQQDAQEFLGFLLEELHEECILAMQRTSTNASSGRSTPVGSVSNMSETPDAQDGWLEVGHKQRSAITRSSGATNADSPITNIFGGKLRSELKVAGNKLSVTLEPYQPLQLDIGSPQVSNIIDALKGLTKPESMQGDFHSARGTKTTATKQVFIETLPPVLILHLKRFQYDSSTNRAEKIWKKVGYPLELEIPKEVFPPTARNKYAAHGGLPKYRLTGVIYHHGKNANGGHYTVDIRRQDGQEWIRMDDTVIRRIRNEDVANGGSEEDPKVLAAALEQHKKQAMSSNNRFENIEADQEEDDVGPAWSQVANGHGRSKSTANAIINGNATPAKDVSGPQTPRYRESVKDNKVAYLLFYQRINI
ncbi:hypothetical protein LTR64_003831 [Lithohypha guttulata]|uniref:uncharacterized protein n=1 Tax=Lithohypha guttulata TaxID=1690604 RepID=UPI002DDFD9CB|nr:hypothetical protein LTR51_006869 [Lithohypha guttulata]